MGHYCFATMDTDNFAAFRGEIKDYLPVINTKIPTYYVFGFIQPGNENYARCKYSKLYSD